MKRLILYALAALIIYLLVRELLNINDVNGQLDGLLRRVG